MTTTTSTPFVNTPFGVGVVEGSNQPQTQLFVRFEDGSRHWLPASKCELDALRPDWYREPETDLIAGYVS